MKSRQVAPDPHPPAQNGVTSVTAATRSFGWGDHSDAMSVMTRETRASAERRRPCSIELTVVLVLEVVIIIASVIILATMGSGDGITFRTDIGALICGLIILLGMLMLALLEIVTNGTKAKEVLLVYLQITIHFNAAALGALTLLGHATWLLAQLLLILAAFAWVVGCCGGAVSLWHWLYYQKVVPKPRMGHLLTLLRALHWKTAFFCWAVLVTLTVVALVFPKLPETVGLSQELSLAEHVLLMGTGGLCYSALFSPLFLALSRRARCTMRRVAGRRKGICLQILIILGLSVVLHFAAGLVIPLAAHILIFILGLMLTWLLVSLTRCARRRAIRPPSSTSSSGVLTALFMPMLGLLKVMAFMALFLFDCAFVERFTSGIGNQDFTLVQRDGSCGQNPRLLTDAALDAMDCAAHARSLGATSFALSSIGGCYSYAMQVTEEDYAHFREKGLESTCNFGFLIWDALPHYDFYVMQPSRESCPFGLSGGPLHRDKRRLAVVGGSAVSYVGGTTLIPAAIEQLWTSLGMAPVGQGLRAVTELYLKAVRSVLALEPYIPKVLPLRCAALRRVASACMLAAALLTFAAVSSFDLLNVMVASQDIAAARAASSGSSLAYLGFVSVGQVLQQLLLILFQVVIAASAQARYEAIGIFDPSCGYLVGSDDLDSESCPNWWHAPIDLIAIIVLMFGFVFCFVLILLLPFRRFIASPAARWVTASLFRHGLRRPLLWPAKLPETMKLPMLAWPIGPLFTSFGVWTEGTMEIEQCSGRLEWLDPMPREEETTTEGEEAAGANFDLVSTRSMADASTYLCAFAWLPVPFVGPIMCKVTMYLNRRRVFTCGRDGPDVAKLEDEDKGFEFDMKRRDEHHLQHLLQEMPVRLQVPNWCCSSLLLLFLLLIEVAPGETSQDRVDVLAVFMALALVIAIFWCVTDLLQMWWTFQAGQQLVATCEEFLSNKPLDSLDGIDRLEDLSPGDKFRVKLAWRQLRQLLWIQQGRLPSAVCAWLNSRGCQTNAGQMALILRRKMESQQAKQASPEKADEPEVKASVFVAAQVLLLRAAAYNDLCLMEAEGAARKKAHADAFEAAKARAPAFQKWCEHKAATRAAAAANALLMAYQSRDLQEAKQPSGPLWMRFSFCCTTEAKVSALPCVFRRRMLQPQEASYGISVWGYVHLEWPTDKEDIFSPHDALVTHLDMTVERPESGEGEAFMSLPSLEGTPPDPVAPQGGPKSLEWWEDHLGCRVACPDPKKAFRLQVGSPHFMVRETHLPAALPALPKQEAAVLSLLPDLKFLTKDEHLHVLWNHAVEADQRLTGTPAPQDPMISHLEDAIRASAWPTRTWILAGVFFAGLADSLKGRSSLSAEQAARRAMLLGICAKLMAKNGRRRDAHARELDFMDSQSDEGEIHVEEVVLPKVSFRNFSVDLSDQPTSPTSVATQALREALSHSPVDLEELSMALEHARRADVDAMLLQRGEEIFMSIIEKQGAVTRLATAIQNRMLKELRAAVRKAEEVQLEPTEYPDAEGRGILQRARDVVKEEELAALEELRSAMGGGALRLQRALTQAEEAHVEQHEDGAELLRAARQNLEAIARKKQCIALLKVALESGNVGLLEAAIHQCERENMEGEVNLDAARRRLATLQTAAQKLKARQAPRPMSPGPAPVQEIPEPETPVETPEERAANMLKAALCHEPLDARLLRLALHEALAVGLQGAEVQRAQELLASLESKAEALEEVRRAGAERNAQALATAIKRCRKLGIHPQELLQALQQLTDEMAKVAKIAGDHGISNLMLEDVEQTRRELHDKVQAVRGGVRVICRIRPFVEDDDIDEGVKPAVEEVDYFTLKLESNKMNQLPGSGSGGNLDESFREANLATEAASNMASNRVTQATSNFRFNGRVLGPKSTQEDVFSEVQGLVQSAIDGYNVLLATGGTKFSGKTHTMFGPPFKKPAPGMPKERDWSGLATRVANEIFTIQERDDWRALLEVEMQVVEIRGDRTVDLLGRTSRPDLNDTRSGHLAFAGAMLLGGGGESSFIDGASSRRISDRNEFMRVLNSAFTATEGAYAAPKSPRTPASTVSTARGEPHVVVALHFTRTNRATGAALRSKLMLADLAPMSSPAAGGTIGSTNKEVAAAYHAIEAVIKSSRRDGQAAAQSTARRKHVLGQILRDCLCGNARPVFLMTLNPSPTEKVHTMHAVTFATALGGRSAR